MCDVVSDICYDVIITVVLMRIISGTRLVKHKASHVSMSDASHVKRPILTQSYCSISSQALAKHLHINTKQIIHTEKR